LYNPGAHHKENNMLRDSVPQIDIRHKYTIIKSCADLARKGEKIEATRIVQRVAAYDDVTLSATQVDAYLQELAEKGILVHTSWRVPHTFKLNT
jgi:hypothetical protein